MWIELENVFYKMELQIKNNTILVLLLNRLVGCVTSFTICLWVMILCSLVGIYQCVGETYHLYFLNLCISFGSCWQVSGVDRIIPLLCLK